MRHLLDLPDLCLALILCRIPLYQLLVIATVCKRINQVKGQVCLNKRKLAIIPKFELTGYQTDLFALLNSIGDLEQNCLRTNQKYRPNSIRFYVRGKQTIYRKLSNLAVLFPNVTHFGMLSALELNSNYNETFVSELAKLLQCWSGTLTHLSLCIDQKFYNSILTKTIKLYLTKLDSLSIDLGKNANKNHLRNMVQIASTRVSRLVIGPIYDLNSIYEHLADESKQIRVQSWGFIYRSQLRFYLKPAHRLARNVQLDNSLTNLSIQLGHNVNMHDLSLVCDRFRCITFLHVYIIADRFNFDYSFSEFPRTLFPLSKLHTLKITTSNHKCRFSLPIFPFWFLATVEMPKMASVKLIQIFAGNSRKAITTVIHNASCSCSSWTRLINGTLLCTVASAFPAAQIQINWSIKRRQLYKAYLAVYVAFYFNRLFTGPFIGDFFPKLESFLAVFHIFMFLLAICVIHKLK